ncbi:MAG: Ig-like domain-containing protein [Nanoarchaeota archaeon]|nr:tandem-95 repeat protein [Nanoarchaeota archaeon]MBU1631896.1 tandem-95 repeat protein [Nanoarchaeota archaeon]MBU1875917.1 tandem-95 repeat protein [Nanoarchaeota archaeon]
MKKTNKLLTVLFVFLLIVSIVATSVLASGIALTSFWTDNYSKQTSVIQGENQELYVSVLSDSFFKLRIEVLDKDYKHVKTVIEEYIPSTNYEFKYPILTKDLSIGDYKVLVSVLNNNGDGDDSYLSLTVNPKTPNNPENVTNLKPTISVPGDRQVNENEKLSFTVQGNDPDSNSILGLTYDARSCKLSYSLFGYNLCIGSGPLPDGAALTSSITMPSGQKQGVFTYTPDYDTIIHPDLQDVKYIQFRVYDGKDYSKWKTVDITVNDVNRNPVAVNNAATTNEDNLVSVPLLNNDYDPDAEDVLTISSTTSPKNGVVTINGNSIDYTPNANFNGVDYFTYTINDGYGGQDTATVTITVNSVNDAPVAVDDNASTLESALLYLNVLANDYDPEGDSLTIVSVSNPASGTAFISGFLVGYLPDANFAGIDTFTYTISDGNGGQDTATVTFTVKPINDAPVLNSIGNKEVDEGKLLGFTISASDIDNDPLTYSADNLPAGAVFDANTQKFSWTPGYDQAGNYQVTFKVSDGLAEDSETITITVNNVNQGPQLNPIGDKTTEENQLLTFIVTATDFDNDQLTLTAENLPEGASFTDGIFSWIPNYSQAGNYLVTFKATDGKSEDSETIAIIVVNVNGAPVITSVPPETATEGIEFTYQVVAVDHENDPLTYNLFSAIEGISITSNGLVQGWIPSSSGCPLVTVTVSDGEFTAQQKFTPCVKQTYRNIKFNTVQFSQDTTYPGEYAMLKIGAENNGDFDFNDAKITAMIYDLGVEASTSEFDFDSGYSTTETIYIPVPYYAEPGQYLVKVTVSNSEYHESTYRMLYVN